jgi:hypothetical protein
MLRAAGLTDTLPACCCDMRRLIEAQEEDRVTASSREFVEALVAWLLPSCYKVWQGEGRYCVHTMRRCSSAIPHPEIPPLIQTRETVGTARHQASVQKKISEAQTYRKNLSEHKRELVILFG